MSDWLNEYERFSEAAHVLGVENEVNIKLKSSDRMACVIRELAPHVQHRTHCPTSLSMVGSPGEPDSRQCECAIRNLSSDAEEVLKANNG